MKSISVPLIVLFALALPVAVPPASAQQGGPFQCMATSAAGGHVTVYVSQLIPSGGAGPSPALNSAWGDYVKGAYKLDSLSSATCRPLPADPSIQQRFINAQQNAWQRQNIQVVQVNWQPGQKQDSAQNTNPYAAAQSPAAGQEQAQGAAAGNQNAPAADQGGAPRASYCYSDVRKPTIYFSDAFDTADIQNPDLWVNAFIKLLVDKYKYKGTVECKDTDTIFNAQEAIREQKDTLQGKQLIDTDWTYEPPPGDSAAADDSAPPPPPAKKKPTAKTTPQN